MAKEKTVIEITPDLAIRQDGPHWVTLNRYVNKGETYWLLDKTYMTLDSLIRKLPTELLRNTDIQNLQQLCEKLQEVTETLATMCEQIEVTHEGTGRGSVKIARKTIKCGTE